jgi:hypothetical membrane protein
VVLMGIITGETLYPGYSTSGNEISDLGATRPPDSVIVQPSATIFNLTMMVTGMLIIGASALLFHILNGNRYPLLLALFGIGALGVGIFPGNFGDIHPIFALLTFSMGGVAALMTYKVVSGPFGFISVVLGAIALGMLVIYSIVGDVGALEDIGTGGVERWVAYPIVMWTAGMGGRLMGGGVGTKLKH